MCYGHDEGVGHPCGRSASGSWAFDFVGELDRCFGRFGNRAFIVFDGIRGRSAVVVVTPNTVPDSRNGDKTDKYDRGIVHTLQGDGLESRHTE